jgi:hypothetical protein
MINCPVALHAARTESVSRHSDVIVGLLQSIRAFCWRTMDYLKEQMRTGAV